MQQLYHYLPLSEAVRARSLYVLAAGSASLPAGASYPPSTHPQHHRFCWHQGRVLQEYQIIYIAQGGGRLETASAGERQVRAGDLFVLFPGEWHRYSPDPAIGWEEHWVAFDGKDAAKLMAEHDISRENPLLHTGCVDSLQREFLRIAEEVTEEATGYQNIAAARLQLALALGAASHQRGSLQAADVREVIKQTKERLREQMDQPTDMEKLAADLHVGYSWLRKMFRRDTGMPLAQYQTQLRLHHACALLRNTTLPIASIGDQSGFESAYYFARVFRSKLGCSPSEYRLQSRTLPIPSEDERAA